MREDGLAGVPANYIEPAMILNQNKVTVLECNSQDEVFLARMVTAFEAQGYDCMNPIETYTQELSEDAALVSSLVVHYKKDGSELNRAPATYVLH